MNNAVHPEASGEGGGEGAVGNCLAGADTGEDDPAADTADPNWLGANGPEELSEGEPDPARDAAQPPNATSAKPAMTIATRTLARRRSRPIGCLTALASAMRHERARLGRAIKQACCGVNPNIRRADDRFRK